MTRLVLAQLRRLRREMWVVSMIGVGGMLTSSPMGARMNAAMGALVVAGACTTLGLFWGREMRVLPITPRNGRRSAWIAIIGMVAALQCVRLITFVLLWAFGEDWSGSTASTLVALAVFDLLYVSGSFTIYDRPDPVTPAVKALRLAAVVLWVLLPFAAPEVIPRDLDAFSWWNWLALAGLAGLALRPLLVDLDEWPRLGIVRDGPPRDPVPSPRRLSTFERLSGFWRLAPGWTLEPLVLAMLAVAPMAFGLFRMSEAPMSLAWPDTEFLVLGGPIFLAIAGPLAWGSGLTPWLLRLKVLPVSARVLTAMATLLPCRAVIAVWLLAAALHVAKTGEAPETFRLGALFAACGVYALCAALAMRVRNAGAITAVTFLPFVIVFLLLTTFEWMGFQLWTDALLPVIGFLTGASALMVNYRSFNYSSSQAVVYRPFGQAA